ncbi:MFS transporter [Rubrobacter marinus]|uniref:MFS transporter n=1 Tax=Rubrobacter marinus TaxID=2653852 RepID=A0A6G8PY27_9ACTN|nr:MFS transporter [Rubrobacter marinus]QIN79144.1 MFS transporter [Rubrobacter marinus]
MATTRRHEGDTDETVGEHPHSVWKDHNLHVVWTVTLMAVLGTSSITPAFPTIVQELGVSPGQVVLLITFFTLPGVLLTFVSGVLSDRFGRKAILVPSLFLFGIAGGACMFVRDFELLLGLRALQGVGAASLGATNVTLIGDLFFGNERTEALGYNSSVLSIGTASYPAIGGALATFAWYYPFALPLFAIPIAFLVMFSLHNPDVRNEQGFKEYFGSVWEHVRDKRVAGLFVGSLVTFVILFGSLITYLPILMNEFFRASPFVIGVVVASSSLTTALTSTQMGRLSSRFSEKALIRLSFILYAVALCAVPLAPNVWTLLVATVVFGVAQSLNLPNSFSLLTAAAPTENRGAFLALNSTILRLGQTVGPLLMSAAAAGFGLGGAYFAAAVLAVVMSLLALVLIR